MTLTNGVERVGRAVPAEHPAGRADAGAVDHHAQRAELAGRVEGRAHRGLVGHVGGGEHARRRPGSPRPRRPSTTGRSTSTALPPALTSRRAVASPSPLAPPVTSATLPVMSTLTSSSTTASPYRPVRDARSGPSGLLVQVEHAGGRLRAEQGRCTRPAGRVRHVFVRRRPRPRAATRSTSLPNERTARAIEAGVSERRYERAQRDRDVGCRDLAQHPGRHGERLVAGPLDDRGRGSRTRPGPSRPAAGRWVSSDRSISTYARSSAERLPAPAQGQHPRRGRLDRQPRLVPPRRSWSR